MACHARGRKFGSFWNTRSTRSGLKRVGLNLCEKFAGTATSAEQPFKFWQSGQNSEETETSETIERLVGGGEGRDSRGDYWGEKPER